jgi:hypothetical protein
MHLHAPETPEQWWANVDAEWDNLLNLISDRLNVLANATIDCTTDTPLVLRNIIQDLIWCKQNRDHKRLHRYLFATWQMNPDKPWIHDQPGWGTLCDLLSEDWVFQPEEVQP